MKKGVHPKYYKNAKVVCACGKCFTTGSTMEEINTEICSQCHPFFTGKQKFIDTARRVERFEAKQKKAAAVKATRKNVSKKVKHAKKAASKKKEA